MRISNPSNYFRACLAFVASAALGFASFGAAGAEGDAAVETYDWSAALVAFDEASSTMTVKARIEAHANIDGLADFSAGDRLTLVWTGRQWAAGVRDIGRDLEYAEGTLTLPIEFVATDDENRYVTFRVPVPSDSFDKIAALEPGDRVTGISPKMAKSWDSAVLSARHYNDIS